MYIYETNKMYPPGCQHNGFVVITRAPFHDYIYIMPLLLIGDWSTVCRWSLMATKNKT